MSAIIWDDSYSVGVPALDEQHKILIDLINQLDTVESDGGDIRDVMDKLDWYVREHFALEENMLTHAGYANLEPHKAEHRDFEAWLRSAQSHMATGGLDAGVLVSTIRDHLKDWLVKHILVADMDYKNDLAV